MVRIVARLPFGYPSDLDTNTPNRDAPVVERFRFGNLRSPLKIRTSIGATAPRRRSTLLDGGRPTCDNRASRAVFGASQRRAPRAAEPFQAIGFAGATGAAHGPRDEVDILRNEFDEWSNSLPRRGNLLVARQQIASVLRGVKKPQPAPLMHVSDLASHSGPVLYEQYTPSARELDSGNVLLDAQHQSGRRWMFYKASPFTRHEADHVSEGVLVIPTDDPFAPQQVEETSKPTQEQLDSGKYWLDSDNGTHRWYRIEDPKWLLGSQSK
jgi:hypothetical protein